MESNCSTEIPNRTTLLSSLSMLPTNGNGTMNDSGSTNGSGTTSGSGINWFWHDELSIQITVGFYILLAVMIVCGNSLVIFSFHWKPILRTKTNWYLVSLAVADLMVGLVSVPFYSYMMLSMDFQFAKYYNLLDILAGTSSIMHLIAITIERFHAIYKPLQHRQMRKGRTHF